MRTLLPLTVALLAGGCAAPTLLSAYSRPDQTRMLRAPALSASAPAEAQQAQALEAEGGGGLEIGDAYGAPADPSVQEKLELGTKPEPPLMGWDGDVVAGDLPGNTVEESSGARSLEPSPTGRMYIIELYQQVLDERDALAGEVAVLEQTLAETRALLSATSDSLQQLEARVVDLEARYQALQGENLDLSARLTTAQIRRLEAEKMLLEAQIQWHRSQQEPEGAELAQGGAAQ
jgi:hypothetical protein